MKKRSGSGERRGGPRGVTLVNTFVVLCSYLGGLNCWLFTHRLPVGAAGMSLFGGGFSRSLEWGEKQAGVEAAGLFFCFSVPRLFVVLWCKNRRPCSSV